MADALELDTDYLPPVARQLAADIGLDATLALIQAHGGTSVYVPVAPTPALERLLGAAAAATLCDYYHAGSDRLAVPRCQAAVRAAWHQRIVAAYRAGTGAARLARDHGVTERTIYAVVARARAGADDRQAELF